VSLSYVSGQVTDVTSDPRVIFSTPSNDGLFGVISSRIVPLSGQSGSGDLGVSFQGRVITSRVTITVARSSVLVVSASPYPVYPNSNATSVNVFSRVVGSVYEAAFLSVSLELTNQQSLPLTVQQAAPPSVFDPVTTGLSAIASVQGGVLRVSAAGSINTVASFQGLTSAPLPMTVADSTITVTSLFDLRSTTGAHLYGIAGSVAAFLDVSAAFSDSYIIESLYSNERAIFPDPIEFSIAQHDGSEAVDIDWTSGAVRLVSNQPEF